MKKPKVKPSPAQLAAARKNLLIGRQDVAKRRKAYKLAHHGHGPPPSKKQVIAARKNIITARIDQARKRQGKKPVPPKQRAAMPESIVLPGWSWVLGCNDQYPTCAAAAVANHLYASTGIMMAEHEVHELHKLSGGDEDGGAVISDILEFLASHRTYSAGGRQFLLSRFTEADSSVVLTGLVVGLDLPHGSHAVLSHPDGMVSWGRVVPWYGEAEEAWALEWAW